MNVSFVILTMRQIKEKKEKEQRNFGKVSEADRDLLYINMYVCLIGETPRLVALFLCYEAHCCCWKMKTRNRKGWGGGKRIYLCSNEENPPLGTFFHRDTDQEEFDDE